LFKCPTFKKETPLLYMRTGLIEEIIHHYPGDIADILMRLGPIESKRPTILIRRHFLFTLLHGYGVQTASLNGQGLNLFKERGCTNNTQFLFER